MAAVALNPAETAVILIDLQKGIVGNPLAPRPASEVLATAAALAKRFRERGSPIVYVHVDVQNFVQNPVDQPSRDPNAPPPPREAMDIVPEAGMGAGDILIVKRHWDAFANTPLTQKLRDRHVTTVVIGGVASHIGVESTARSAASLGFAVVIAEDACSDRSAEAHRYAMEKVFPRLGRVRPAAEIVPA